MRKNIIYLGLAASMLLSAACSSYKVTGVQRTRTLIDARYDKPLDSWVKNCLVEDVDYIGSAYSEAQKFIKQQLGQ